MSLISIDPRRQIGRVDPKLYGGFIEHLGKCIYGGIYDPDSRLADEAGFREDVIEAVRKLRIPIMRWPGGNFVSGYHWQDAIGPSDQRPARPEQAWGVIETNQFGTDEFTQWCRLVGTEPYICVNAGTGTLDEAAQWVAYCNREDETYWAQQRRENGYDKPHRVKYWGLGNELYGDWQLGHKNAVDYAKTAREFAKMMKRTDPSIKLVACGAQNLDWDREVLAACAPLVDYISYHDYWRPQGEDYYSLFSGPHRSEQYLRLLWELIQYIRRENDIAHPIRICADEWNVWYRSDVVTEREVYDLRDALCVATFLNVLQRNCDAVGIANIAQVVNVIAPIWADPEGIFLQTIYWPFFAASNYSGTVSVDVHCKSPSFAAAADVGGNLPHLDVAATIDQSDNKLFVSVVNRHRDEEITTTVEVIAANLASEGRIHLITGDDPKVTNSFQEPDNVQLATKQLQVGGNVFAHSFLPCSVTVLELQLQ